MQCVLKETMIGKAVTYRCKIQQQNILLKINAFWPLFILQLPERCQYLSLASVCQQGSKKCAAFCSQFPQICSVCLPSSSQPWPSLLALDGFCVPGICENYQYQSAYRQHCTATKCFKCLSERCPANWAPICWHFVPALSAKS